MQGCNFYRAAIPNFATIAAPLHKLLQGKKPRFAPLVFSKEADVAFDNLKLALCSHATLAHPRSDADTVLVSDASNFDCGASIMQRIDNAWRPIFQHAAKINWHAFAKAQRNDYELKRYLDETNSANVIEH